MKNSHPAQIFIVDDHPILVTGLVALLEKTDDLEVCGRLDTVNSLFDFIKSSAPDLIVLDIHLQSADGFEILKRLNQEYSGIPVLVFSMHDEAFYAERALQSGAKGYLMKSESPDTIRLAIRRVLRNELYVSQRLQSLLLAQLDTSSTQPVSNPIKKLSNRELQVIQLIGKGKSNREIAEIMKIRLKTVEAHRFRIKEKLNVRHSAELMQFAIQWVNSEAAFQSHAPA